MKAQHLTPFGEGSSPAGIVETLQAVVGVQAQDMAASPWAIHLRNRSLSPADIDLARQEPGRVVHTWAMRGTLHLLAVEDVRWMLPLFAATIIAGNRRRMAELGWDEERTARGLQLLEAALAENGKLTRPQISSLLADHGLPSAGQAPVHLIYRAAWEGMLVQGPDLEKKPAYTAFESWVGQPLALPREEALARLTRRYLEAYGPAAPEDMANWSGLKTKELRPIWQALAGSFIPVEIDGQAAWLLPSSLTGLDLLESQAPVVNLLPRFDNYLLGYAGREMALGPQDAPKVNAGGGMIAATVAVDGQVQGVWHTRMIRGGMEILVEMFEELAFDLIPLLEDEVPRLGEFLGVKTVLKFDIDEKPELN